MENLGVKHLNKHQQRILQNSTLSCSTIYKESQLKTKGVRSG